MTQTLDILEKLIGFPTVNANSNHDIIDYIQDFLTTRGMLFTGFQTRPAQRLGCLQALAPSAKGYCCRRIPMWCRLRAKSGA